MKQKTECLQPDLEHLIECYGNTILRFCYLYLLDLDQARQAVQDVFIKAYNDPDFQEQKLNEKKLFRITVRQCRKRLVHRKGLPVYAADSLLTAFHGMTPLERESVLLYYYLGLPIADVATISRLPIFCTRCFISAGEKIMERYFVDSSAK